MNQLVIFNNETTERQMYSTLDVTQKENKAKLFNATENADALAMDCVNTELVLKDVYLEKIPKVNEETGEVEGSKYRTILFDEDGKTYASGAYGMYNTVSKILAIYGIEYLHEEGLKVIIARGSSKEGKNRLFLKIAE